MDKDVQIDMPGTWIFKVTLTCCCLCLKCCSYWVQPGMAMLKNQSKALNSVIYKMMKTVSDHINERKLAMQLVLNFIEVWPNQFRTVLSCCNCENIFCPLAVPSLYSLYVLWFALLISVEINIDVTSGAELLWELWDSELYLCQVHVVMQSKIICILWSIDKLKLRLEK